MSSAIIIGAVGFSVLVTICLVLWLFKCKLFGTDCGSPGSASPGSTSPGSTSPGSTSPGSTSPGSTSLGSTSPGSASPGSTSPGSTSPGSTSPGSTRLGPAIGTYNEPNYGASIIIDAGGRIQLMDPNHIYGSTVSDTMINITSTSFQVPNRPAFTYDTNKITYAGDDFTLSTCPLTCTGSDLTLAQNYYNNSSVFAGTFTMEPNGGTKSSDTTCLINYNWRNLNTFATDTDTQIFTYGTGCSKDVISITRP